MMPVAGRRSNLVTPNIDRTNKAHQMTKARIAGVYMDASLAERGAEDTLNLLRRNKALRLRFLSRFPFEPVSREPEDENVEIEPVIAVTTAAKVEAERVQMREQILQRR
jgi:hypothetical protein